ncbi:bacteriochlorophyll 4-vinyl reductase [Roseovarius phycicola]|uniref:Bacteriochlorophyll 4-vinyl reductase n=1 Tax=Roseovarius phycicola TaxID=3080976 RepID=A0ABZ2HHI8_9RHOB
MSRPKNATSNVIGPNAVLQLLPLIERLGGTSRVTKMLKAAGMDEAPDGTEMIPEAHAARLHQLLRKEEPQSAPLLAAEAGRATAAYILAHRIPQKAQTLLRLLPARLAAILLSKAITKHAWTFAGSGQFECVSPWTYRIKDNPVVRGEVSQAPLCTWHAAVFEHLYQVLVHPRCRCVETHCCAQLGSEACVFAIDIAP